MYNFNCEYMTFLYVVHVYMFCNVVLYCIADLIFFSLTRTWDRTRDHPYLGRITMTTNFQVFDLHQNIQQPNHQMKLKMYRSSRGHDPMVAGFTTTYAISTYHH